jgi:hypothetical protein
MFGVSEKIYNFVIQIKNRIMPRKRKSEPKQNPAYMLFIFGDFTELESLAQDFSIQFLPVVSSPFLKFTYGEYGVVFHFRSGETFTELKEYVDMVFGDITDQYFLMEVGKNIDIKMSRKLKRDFLNIDSETKKEETKTGGIDVEEMKKDVSIDSKSISIEMILPILGSNLFSNPQQKVEDEPTVDEILDKITEKGIESLTEKEKLILENYGKGKNGGY